MNPAEDSSIEFRRIPASDTLALRDAVLRRGLPPGGSRYPGDDAADTLHLGAFLDSMLVAAATLCREPRPGELSETSWRLRGMSTLPAYQGLGLGRQLAQRCIAYASEHGATLVWCTSRVATAPFHRALGFIECSDIFSLPQFSDAL